MSKIGILGKMGAGKTTLANEFIKQNPKYTKLAFADKIKILAKELFGMTTKDRQLLQQIGEKMREIKPTVWVNYVIEQAKSLDYVVIDDVRYENEIMALKAHGFKIIYINLDEITQINRLKNTYGDEAHEHLNNLQHESECADKYQELADIKVNFRTLNDMSSFVKNYHM